MKKYCYFMFGMFTGTDENRYNICIPSPFVRGSKAEAMKDENVPTAFGLLTRQDFCWSHLQTKTSSL
jgi:hypothetical protein